MAWVGVNFDGVLARIPGEQPVAPMVDLVKRWIDAGLDIRIVTARVASTHQPAWRDEQRGVIERWCQQHLGIVLPVTAEKDFSMICLFDDSCVQVERNTGKILGRDRYGLAEY